MRLFSHAGNSHALIKLVSIVLQLTNQIKLKFPGKSYGAKDIFIKLL